MPKVIIWRDDAVEMEFDPSHRDWRIGRSETNDIALLDPRKSVSRFHAELREEGGRWYFIDLNSQNGSWHDNQRVTRLELRHENDVLFGDYRLVFVDPPTVPVLAPPARTEPATAPVAAAPVGAEPADVPPDQTLMMPSSKKTDEPPTPPLGTPIVRPAGTSAASPRKGINPVILLAFLFVMGLAVLAVGWRVWQSMATETPATAGPITPEPAEPAPPLPPPPPEPEPEAEDAAADPPPAEPDATAAQAPKQTAKAARPPPKRPPAEPQVPPAVNAAYEDARRAIGAGRYAEAITALQALEAERPGFRDVAQLIDDARRLQKEAIARDFAEGRRLEAAENWPAAVAAYQRAGASSEAAAVRTKMHTAGDEAYRRARQFDARNRPVEALGWYERAVEWLPSSDDRRQTAQQRIAVLKGGGA